jgi:hypothetical protein
VFEEFTIPEKHGPIATGAAGGKGVQATVYRERSEYIIDLPAFREK